MSEQTHQTPEAETASSDFAQYVRARTDIEPRLLGELGKIMQGVYNWQQETGIVSEVTGGPSDEEYHLRLTEEEKGLRLVVKPRSGSLRVYTYPEDPHDEKGFSSFHQGVMVFDYDSSYSINHPELRPPAGTAIYYTPPGIPHRSSGPTHSPNSFFVEDRNVGLRYGVGAPGADVFQKAKDTLGLLQRATMLGKFDRQLNTVVPFTPPARS